MLRTTLKTQTIAEYLLWNISVVAKMKISYENKLQVTIGIIYIFFYLPLLNFIFLMFGIKPV